ncbi:MAG: acetyl-CoA C-acyltransferase [bacterium]
MATRKKNTPSLGGDDRVAIVAAVRTPFVKAWAEFKDYNEADLTRFAVNELLNRVSLDPRVIDECIVGCVSAPMNGPNVAREVVLRSQLPREIPAYTVQMYCASSGLAAVNGVGDILTGVADTVLVGGVESMSSAQARFTLSLTHALNDASKARTVPDRLKAFAEVKLKDLKPDVPSIAEPTTGKSMGDSAEDMAKHYKVSRADQDQWSLTTHHRAAKAHADGKFPELVSVNAGPKFDTIVDRDTLVRGDTTLEKMAKLRPVFDRRHGTVTAANASPLTDGASALLLMRESKAKALGLKPMAYIKSHAIAALDLTKYEMLLGPTFATPKALSRAGLTLKDMGLVEMHEAFAAQVLANAKIWGDKKLCGDLGLDTIGEVDMERLNVNGGSIPIGHPFGATGARLLMQLAGEMERRDLKYGLATACAAGGLGFSMVLERD